MFNDALWANAARLKTAETAAAEATKSSSSKENEQNRNEVLIGKIKEKQEKNEKR